MSVIRHRAVRIVVAVVAALVGAVLLVPAGGAGAEPAWPAVYGPARTVLGISSFREIVTDPANGRLYVSGGDRVTVLTPTGQKITHLNVPGASGLAVEGSTLWVTQVGAGKVARVDLASLSVAQTYTIGTTVGDSIAAVDGSAWLMGDFDGDYADLIRLDPNGDVSVRGGHIYQGRVVGLPGSITHVLVHDRGLSPFSVHRVDLTGPTVELEDETDHDVGSNLADIAVTDSQTFVTASGAPYEFPEFAVGDMDETGVVYAGTNYPNGVAYDASDGGVLVGTTSATRKAFVFRDGVPTAVETVTAPHEIYDRGVTVGADAKRFHLVVDGPQGPELLTYALEPDCAIAGPFPDVGVDHPFCEDVLWLAGSGITGGYPDGTFRPARPVSRQEMAAFLYRVDGEPPFSPGAPSFSDVPASHPFFHEIEWLSSSGITGGYADGTFRPNASVTRQEMAAFLYRAGGEPPFSPGAPSFSDVPASHPFFDEIEWLADVDVTGGFPDGTFRPGGLVTRQEMAAFLQRYTLWASTA